MTDTSLQDLKTIAEIEKMMAESRKINAAEIEKLIAETRKTNTERSGYFFMIGAAYIGGAATLITAIMSAVKVLGS